MGGGDLNLKKSWHPQTLRNVEKVWKAEQKAEAESKKIDQLRKELEEERAREEMQRHAVQQGIAKKKGERLDWMYAAAAAGQVDRELYLLGKAVDKAVDPMAQENEEDLSAPGASFMNDTGANTANDLAAKVRDDPLFLIKRKEEEKRKELLNNPVKMKQLKMILQANLDKSSKKKKDKKRKREKGEKKRRKERHVRESDSESEDDEREMAKESKRKRKEKYNRRSDDSEGDEGGMAKEHDRRREERNRRRSDGSDDEREMAKDRKSRRKEEGMEMWNGNHRKHHRESNRSKEEEDERRTYHRNGEHYSSRHRSPDRKRPQVRSRSRSPMNRRDRERRNEQRHRRNSSGSPSRNRRHRSRSPSHSPPRKSRRSPSPDRRKSWQKGGSVVTKQIDTAEKEKRLAAMMENAKWRDEQRGKNVKRYKEEDAKLAAEEALNSDKSAAFLNDVKIQSFSSKTTSSVSDRIRRNINSVQRTTAALESFLGK